MRYGGGDATADGGGGRGRYRWRGGHLPWRLRRNQRVRLDVWRVSHGEICLHNWNVCLRWSRCLSPCFHSSIVTFVYMYFLISRSSLTLTTPLTQMETKRKHFLIKHILKLWFFYSGLSHWMNAGIQHWADCMNLPSSFWVNFWLLGSFWREWMYFSVIVLD